MQKQLSVCVKPRTILCWLALRCEVACILEPTDNSSGCAEADIKCLHKAAAISYIQLAAAVIDRPYSCAHYQQIHGPAQWLEGRNQGFSVSFFSDTIGLKACKLKCCPKFCNTAPCIAAGSCRAFSDVSFWIACTALHL